ncbi:MAG: hypothetical protein Q3991_08805 [Rothia sp. (in: high G+C Gram-positive bacteria)]|uniref:hypothetical protein n=1 Tax=Rothia sp. (in: high G+C Gram-positive bacteria) TaxID=1885016 RepID=UPI0026DBE7BA|nr:hypothetical protein [Rothia sp. (in: high G+C Gram-positive bacteria)]MDO4885032.1 hypothetical protein [Rothia sp. (in: high G+C Gram-positive bacteria)]
MLSSRKNTAIVVAASLMLSIQIVGAVADEASSSGTVGNGKFTVTSSKIKAGQEHNNNVVIVAPTQGQGAPSGQQVPENGQLSNEEATRIMKQAGCTLNEATRIMGAEHSGYECTEKPAASDTGNAISQQQYIAAQVRDGLDSLDISKPVLHNDFGLHAYTDLNINYYVTQAGVQTKETTILDEKVTIQVIPVSYQYTYGNGAVRTTSSAGVPGTRWEESEKNYTETSTSYQFEKAGNFHSYVTVVYQARYRIGDNGPWMVAGTTQMRSDAMLLRVWEIDVHNVAKDCREDPYAWACPLNKNRPDYNNPNPKLAHPDPFTGQQWHKDNEGVGDTERGKNPRSRERG